MYRGQWQGRQIALKVRIPNSRGIKEEPWGTHPYESLSLSWNTEGVLPIISLVGCMMGAAVAIAALPWQRLVHSALLDWHLLLGTA